MSEAKKLDMAPSTIADGDCLLLANDSGTVKRVSIAELLSQIKIGGRNFVADSDKGISNNYYRMGTFNWASKPVVGEKVLVTIWGELGANRTSFAVFNSNGDGNPGMVHLKKVEDGVYSGFLPIKLAPSDLIAVYAFPNDTATHGVSTIERIKIERGNIITDWSPAPEDLRGGVIPYGSNSYICITAKPEKGGRRERGENSIADSDDGLFFSVGCDFGGCIREVLDFQSSEELLEHGSNSYECESLVRDYGSGDFSDKGFRRACSSERRHYSAMGRDSLFNGGRRLVSDSLYNEGKRRLSVCRRRSAEQSEAEGLEYVDAVARRKEVVAA